MESKMAKARRQTRTTTDTILRRLESARKQFEQTFERAIRSVEADAGSGTRRTSKPASNRGRKAAATRSRMPVRKASTGKGRPAPVQTAIANVLSRRKTGMTMERLQGALPAFDQKSLLNATFVMRKKGTVTFERSGKARGKYRWAD